MTIVQLVRILMKERQVLMVVSLVLKELPISIPDQVAVRPAEMEVSLLMATTVLNLDKRMYLFTRKFLFNW